jgi:hypothetical protein
VVITEVRALLDRRTSQVSDREVISSSSLIL